MGRELPFWSKDNTTKFPPGPRGRALAATSADARSPAAVLPLLHRGESRAKCHPHPLESFPGVHPSSGLERGEETRKGDLSEPHSQHSGFISCGSAALEFFTATLLGWTSLPVDSGQSRGSPRVDIPPSPALPAFPPGKTTPAVLGLWDPHRPRTASFPSVPGLGSRRLSAANERPGGAERRRGAQGGQGTRPFWAADRGSSSAASRGRGEPRPRGESAAVVIYEVLEAAGQSCICTCTLNVTVGSEGEGTLESSGNSSAAPRNLSLAR